MSNTTPPPQCGDKIKRSYRARSRSRRVSYRRGRFRAGISDIVTDVMKNMTTEVEKIKENVEKIVQGPSETAHGILDKLNLRVILAAYLFALSTPIAGDQNRSDGVILSNPIPNTVGQKRLDAAHVIHWFAKEFPESEPHRIVSRGTFNLEDGNWNWIPNEVDSETEEYRVGSDKDVQELSKKTLVMEEMPYLKQFRDQQREYMKLTPPPPPRPTPRPRMKWVKKGGGWVHDNAA